jgi:hypothetical protein
MVEKNPLVNYDGWIEEIRAADSIPGSLVVGGNNLTLSLTTVAGEAISAGDVVGTFRGGVRLGYGILSAVAEQDLEGFGITRLAMCALSPTLFVRIYVKSADTKLYGKAFTVNANNTTTDGAEVTLANYAINVAWLVIRRVTDTQFMAGWSKAADSTGYLISGTVAGVTITLGAESQFHAASTGSFDFKFIDASTWLLGYKDQGDSDYGHIVMGTVDGAAAITPDTAHDLKWVSAAVDDIQVGIIVRNEGGASLNRFVLAYEKTLNSYYYMFGQWTGTTPSITNYVEYGAIEAVGIYGHDLIVSDERSWFSVYQLTSGNWRIGMLTPGFCYAIETATYGMKSVFYSHTTGTNGRNFVFKVNDNVLIIVTDEVDNVTLKANLVKWINWHFFFGGISVHASDTDFAASLSTDGQLLAVYFTDSGDAHNGHLIVYDVGLPIGIAAEANAGGSPVAIIRKGYSDVQAGLVAGRRYYAAQDGSLTLTPNGWPILDAISATEAIVDASMESL